jgi:hypothetical protein
VSQPLPERSVPCRKYAVREVEFLPRRGSRRRPLVLPLPHRLFSRSHRSNASTISSFIFIQFRAAVDLKGRVEKVRTGPHQKSCQVGESTSVRPGDTQSSLLSSRWA